MRALAWSGGKDCTLAFIKAAGTVDVLLNAGRGGISATGQLPMDRLREQARRMGMPILFADCGRLTDPVDSNVVEVLRKHQIETLVFADVSKDPAVAPTGAWGAYVEQQGFRVEWPLLDHPSPAREFLATGCQARIIWCKKRPALVGTDLTLDLVTELEAQGFDGSGNVGPFVYHTFVYEGPIFRNGASG